MRSQSQPQKQLPRFEDVLKERIDKQVEWLRKYEDLPLIDDTSKTYKELCDGLIPQEDFFVEQLVDLSSKFQGHYMTKMNKQLKSEKEQLEKLKNEMTSQIKLLVEQNNHKHKELIQVNEELDNQSRNNKHQNVIIEKLKLQLDEYKNKNDELNYQNINSKDYGAKSQDGQNLVQLSLERQLKQRIEDSLEKDAIIKVKEQENQYLQQEIERLIEESESERRRLDDQKKDFSTKEKSAAIQSLEKRIKEIMRENDENLQQKDNELQDAQKQIRLKESLIDMYQKRDQATENTLTFQIEQEQKYQDVVKQYHMLETDWKSMENYIKGLNDYQQHIETKYSLLLDQFQQVIVETEEQKEKLSQEQHAQYQNAVNEKDYEISHLHEEIQKHKNNISLQEEVERLRTLENQASAIEQSYSQALTERDHYIQELQSQLQEHQQALDQLQHQQQQNEEHESHSQNQKDQEIIELHKTKEVNQKLITQLEKQLKKTNSNASTTAANSAVVKKEIDLIQKQLDSKERENEDLRRLRIQDNKDIQTLRREVTDLKLKLSENEQKRIRYQQEQEAVVQELQVEEEDMEDEEYDMNELEFYLKEMKEVKDRVLSSILNAKSFVGECLRSQNREDFSMKVEIFEAKNGGNQDKKKFLFAAKEIVRKELEHLIILNSHSLDLQTVLQDKQSLESPLATKHQQILYQIDRASLKLRSLFVFGTEYDDEGDNGSITNENIEELADQVIATYEILQEENKLLLKEREFYNEHNLKKFVKEIEEAKIDNMRLKDQLKQSRSDEQSKTQDLERQVLDKSQQYSKDMMKLSNQNEQLLQRNTALTNELKQVLQQIEAQADLSEKLQKENHFLKRKLEIITTNNSSASQSIIAPVTAKVSSRDRGGVVGNLASQQQKQQLSHAATQQQQQHYLHHQNQNHHFQQQQYSGHHQQQQQQQHAAYNHEPLSYAIERRNEQLTLENAAAALNARKNSHSPNRSVKFDHDMLAKKNEFRRFQHRGSVDSPDVKGADNISGNDEIRSNRQYQETHSPLSTLNTEPSEKKHSFLVTNHQSALNNTKKNSVISSNTAVHTSQRSGGYALRDEENEKLNSLIDEYRKENERCSQKIQELQDKLHTTSSKFFKEREHHEQRSTRNKAQLGGGHNSFAANQAVKSGSDIQISSTQSTVNNQNNSMHYNFQSEIHPHRLGTGTYSNSTKNLNQQFQTLPEKDVVEKYFSPSKTFGQAQSSSLRHQPLIQPSIHTQHQQQQYSSSFVFGAQQQNKDNLNNSSYYQKNNDLISHITGGSSGNNTQIQQQQYTQHQQHQAQQPSNKPLNLKQATRSAARLLK